MKGYWFSRDDGTTEHQRVPVAIGHTDTFDGEPVPCQRGLHWSPTPWDALQYAAGCRLWEVEGEGGIPHGDPIDKYAGTARTPLRSVDLRPVFVEFSCRQAEGVLDLFEKQYPDDHRPRGAIEAARAFMRGEITEEQLDAAGAASDGAGAASYGAGAASYGAWAASYAAWVASDAAGAASDAAGAARYAAGAASDAARAASYAAWVASDAAGAAPAARTMFNEMALAALEEA